MIKYLSINDKYRGKYTYIKILIWYCQIDIKPFCNILNLKKFTTRD